MNRIEKIRAKRQELDDAYEEKRIETIRLIESYEKRIEELTPEITELIDIAIELIECDFPLGKAGVCIEKDEFVSRQDECKLGFLVEWQVSETNKYHVHGIGFGGNFYVKDDEIIGTPLNNVGIEYTLEDAQDKHIELCKEFFEQFDDFKQRVFDYVDNL